MFQKKIPYSKGVIYLFWIVSIDLCFLNLCYTFKNVFFLLNITFVLLRRAGRANTSTRFTEINSALLAVIDIFLTSNERYVLYITFFLKGLGKQIYQNVSQNKD